MQRLLLLSLLALPVRAEEARVGLVVSGGISLGAYQGGVLFARLKHLRAKRAQTPLTLITGASAGGINAWLAVVGWCDAREERMAFFANPFFDTWTNVGLDVLLPVEDEAASYARLLAEPLGSAQVARIAKMAAERSGRTAPYAEAGQGLLTGSAFEVVGRYLAERLGQDGYLEGCRLRTAVTLTGTEAVTTQLAAGEAQVRSLRYVVPLQVEARGGRLEIRNDNGVLASGDSRCLVEGQHPWEACHPSIGRALGLPEGPGDGVAGLRVVELVKAASAFPVAFAPVAMEVCVSALPGQPAGPGCPGGQARVAGRYIDGGFFDNVPLGPAVEIAHDDELAAGHAAISPLSFLYVDPDLRRGAPRLPEDRRRPDGLGGLGRLVRNTYREARAMELQGLERHCKDELNQPAPVNPPTSLVRRAVCSAQHPPLGARSFQPSTRFHGITGRLAGSFGAFLHRSFRVHDYLIGVYDGLHGITESHVCRNESNPAACRATRFQAEVEALLVGFDAPGATHPALEGQPATAEQVRRFLYRLFVHEHRQLDPAAAAAFCDLELSVVDQEVVCGEGHQALAQRSLVWALHRVYAELDGRLRASVLTADLQHRLRQAELETNLDYVLRALEPYLDAEPARPGELGPDRHAWTAAVLDRLAQRALAVERADQKALFDLGPEVVALNEGLLGLDAVDGLQLARVAVAGGIERDDRFLDLDAGSTERVLGDHFWLPLVHLLVPHHITGDPLYGSLSLGSTPHLRLRGLRSPGQNPNLFERLTLALDAGIGLQDQHPRFPEHAFHARLGGGLGYDPDGRLIDDLDLLYVHSRPLPDWDEAAHGLELSARIATRLRLAVGTFDLRAPDFYFTVGLADWLALLVGLWQG